MAWLMFIDESGHDRRASPYEVLAGVAVEVRNLWNLTLAVQEAEDRFFGKRISQGEMELKGKKLLNRKTFRLAGQLAPLPADRRRELARRCLDKGRAAREEGRTDSGASRAELTALAQAKLAFVEHLLEVCSRHGIRVFASIVDRNAPRAAGDFLRKDYAYLFERYFYFLDEQPDRPHGLVVFDELERSRCHLLVDQMARYFHDTAKGRLRASRIVPEPFFVHSELTTLIQVADIVAYIIAWGVRVGRMERPRREELGNLADLLCQLRHRAIRERNGEPFYVWSFATIDDLRPRQERDVDPF